MKKILLIAALCALGICAQAQEKLYEVKSGIVTMEMDMMGRKIVREIHFDDYGAKQATISEMRGQKMRGVEVNGEMLMINDAENTAMKMPAMGMGGGSNERINFLNTDPKYIKKNKIKVVGTETYLDRECTKYTVALFMMGQVVKQTAWVYKGIVLKSSMATDFGEMVQAATKLEEDVEIPAATFEVPEGVEIQTMSRGPMGGGGGGFGGEF
ncbi:MAG: hypothetical protein IKV75_01895 [Bacteroidales bacterium]|nr:hypothetical protein [Bacteroidales bacterium]